MEKVKLSDRSIVIILSE